MAYKITAIIVGAVFVSTSIAAEMHGGKMSMEHGRADVTPPREVYTGNHLFLVKLLELPQPVPYQEHFTLRFEVYDGQHPQQKLSDARLTVLAGMRHGKEEGFMHGMESSPKVVAKDGVIGVSGMYFHMRGPWVLQMTVHEAGKEGTAELRLSCCG